MSKSRLSGKWNKKIPCMIAVSVVLVSALIVLAIYNYKSIKSAENNFIPAEITNAVQENVNGTWDDNQNPTPDLKDLTWTEDGNGSYTTVKEVKILNADVEGENNTDAYIRVCIIPRWMRVVQETGTSEKTEIDITNVADHNDFGSLTDIKVDEENNTYCMGDVTFKLADNWNENWIFNENDGYFYYKNIVSPGKTTELLLESVSIEKEIYESIDEDVYLRIDIISDSIQTGGGAIEERWEASGITINDQDGTLKRSSD